MMNSVIFNKIVFRKFQIFLMQHLFSIEKFWSSDHIIDQTSLAFNIKRAIKSISAKNRNKQSIRHEYSNFRDNLQDSQTIENQSVFIFSSNVVSQDSNFNNLMKIQRNVLENNQNKMQAITLAPGYNTDFTNRSIFSLRHSVTDKEDINISENSRDQSHRKFLRITDFLKSRFVYSGSFLRMKLAKNDLKQTTASLSKTLIFGNSKIAVSTLLKSMKLAYGGNYTHEERKAWKGLIYNNIHQSMLSIIDAMKACDISCQGADAN